MRSISDKSKVRVLRLWREPTSLFSAPSNDIPSSPLSSYPEWVQEAMVILLLADKGSGVEGVGFRVNEDHFWVYGDCV